MEVLRQDLRVVKTFTALTEPEPRDLLRRMAEAARKGAFEGFKTTNGFDGTALNPNWLGAADGGPSWVMHASKTAFRYPLGS
jgi:hypothetical protein